MTQAELAACTALAKKIRKHVLRMVCVGKSGYIGPVGIKAAVKSAIGG